METKVHYSNLEERAKLVEQYEARKQPRDFDIPEIARDTKLRMLHDDFDADWKPGTEPHGTMTFTDGPEPVPVIPTPRDLASEIDALRARIESLEKAESS